MKAISPGHIYDLDILDNEEPRSKLIQMLTFRCSAKIHGPNRAHPGVTCQEVLRVLIDRVKYLEAEKPHEVNENIINALRIALMLFEKRALERHVIDGKLNPEEVMVNTQDGHFYLRKMQP